MQVAYYGLAAAGIICLAMMRPSRNEDAHYIAMAIQNLHVLVASVGTGAIVDIEDHNYSLLSRATLTIRNLLGRIASGEFHRSPIDQIAGDLQSHVQAADSETPWAAWDSQGFQDFEAEFWTNLADHPFLSGFDDDLHTTP